MLPRLVNLPLQYLSVENRHDDVVEIEPQARVMEDAHNVSKVVQLVLTEKFVVQVERTEHHVHLGHVVVVFRVERVVEAGKLRPCRVDQSQIIQSASSVNVR